MQNTIGIPHLKVRHRSVDAPVTVKGVSPDADGNVILQDSRKEAPGIRRKILGDSQSALGIEMQNGDKTNVLAVDTPFDSLYDGGYSCKLARTL